MTIASLPSLSALAAYGISKNTGFLPQEPPLSRLPHPCYTPWENLIHTLPLLLEDGERFRTLVDAMDVLPTTHLQTEAEWRRAYSVLCMLSQGYIWGGRVPSQSLPPQISIPFLQVSAHLQALPIATYAGLNLWNYRRVGHNLTLPENLVALHTLTGTEDESWFYVISNAMEARAGPIITTMLKAIEAATHGREQQVIAALDYLRAELDEIGVLLERMDERCNPDVFYHRIRPRLAGSRNMEAAGLPKGVFFDEREGRGGWRKYRGGSNGQSSLIQLLDIVLEVRHGNPSFHKEMREYMPGPHARFLNDLEKVANLRDFVQSCQGNPRLTQAYNAAVASLVAFRDKHIQLVTRYILLPGRKSTAHPNHGRRQDLATMNSQVAYDPEKAQAFVGTGGTKLVPFLKQSRDETLLTTMDVSEFRHANNIISSSPDAQKHFLRHH